MTWIPEKAPLPPIKCGLCGHMRDAEPVVPCPECGGKFLHASKKAIVGFGTLLLAVLAAAFAQAVVRALFKTFSGS